MRWNKVSTCTELKEAQARLMLVTEEEHDSRWTRKLVVRVLYCDGFYPEGRVGLRGLCDHMSMHDSGLS